jgi:hypothetical protein
MLESWHRDFILGLRALRNSPVFCFTAILTLALGIGGPLTRSKRLFWRLRGGQ